MVARRAQSGKARIDRGTGEFTAGDSTSGGFTYKSRFEGGPGSDPQQLLGAAHASCFSMGLGSPLKSAGSPAVRIHTDAEVTIRLVDGSPTITRSIS